MNVFLQREDLSNFINENSIVCEIGVKNGLFFEHLVKNNPRLSIAVDLWDFYTLPSQNDLNYNIEDIKKFEVEFRSKFKNTIIHKMTSIEASKLFEDFTFDLVYLDADHTYESTKNDIHAWYPKVKSGGILAGHDYSDYYIEATSTTFGVIKAVDEFVEQNNLNDKFHVTKNGSPEDCWKSWVLYK